MTAVSQTAVPSPLKQLFLTYHMFLKHVFPFVYETDVSSVYPKQLVWPKGCFSKRCFSTMRFSNKCFQNRCFSNRRLLLFTEQMLPFLPNSWYDSKQLFLKQVFLGQMFLKHVFPFLPKQLVWLITAVSQIDISHTIETHVSAYNRNSWFCEQPGLLFALHPWPIVPHAWL